MAGRRLILALVSLAVVVGCADAPAPAVDPADAADEKLRREKALLAAEIELAKTERYYLIVDGARHELVLRLSGATLLELPIERLEVGRPQTLFVPREPPEGWREGVFSGGRVVPEPERQLVEIVPPSPEGAPVEPEVTVPPTPEEAVPAPPRYRVVYDGAVLEVAGRGDEGSPAGGRLLDALGLSSAPWRPKARLRVVLAPEAAAALYRALPAETDLIVSLPASAPASAAAARGDAA